MVIIFEKYFAIKIEIANEKTAEIIIKRTIKARSDPESKKISFEIATALPVLDLFIEYNVTNERDITKVLTIPIKIRNSFLLSFPIT